MSPETDYAPAPAGKETPAEKPLAASRPGYSRLNQDALEPSGAKRLLATLSSEERKKYPITTGVLDYFPDAITMVAHISYLGNQKHNPGQPLHWSRGKSADHEDCIGRHTIERDTVEDNVLHAANRAWRALASLQEMLEKQYDLDPPRGAR